MKLKEFKELVEKCEKEDYVINPHFHITADDFFDIITDAVFPEYFIADPVSGDQARAIICYDILQKIHKLKSHNRDNCITRGIKYLKSKI